MSSTIMDETPLNEALELAEAAPVGLASLDDRRRFVHVNSRAEQILGTSAAILRGRPVTQFVYHDCPLFDLLDRAADLNGEVYAQSISVSGPHMSPMNLSLRLSHDADTKTYVLAFAPYKASLPQAEHMSLANFARMLGHEIKNPLAGLSGAAQLLERSAAPDQTELLRLIRQEADRIRRIVDRMSVFETFSTPHLATTNLHEIIDTVVSMERAAYPGVSFHKDYDPSLPDIEADPDHLHEALLNLLRNAVEASLSNSAPRVDIRTRYEAGVRLATQGPGRTRGALSVHVEDNGEGILPSVADRVFDPFFTTKQHGTGVGLPLVRDIVQAHGGRISFDRHRSVTRFEILLPIPKRKKGNHGR